MYLSIPVRSMLVVLLTLLLIGASQVTATAAATGPSKAEMNKCSSKTYKGLARYDVPLERGGKKYKAIGFIRYVAGDSPTKPKGVLRMCARTIHGSKTTNLKYPTSIKIGSYPRGGSKITWHYSSSGHFATSTQGVALTAGKKQCPIFSGSMTVKNKKYSYTYKPDRSYCN